MPTIRKRVGKKGITYEVQIRIRPFKINKSFKTEKKAEIWAAKTETEIRENRYRILSDYQKKTLSDAIERYRKYVLPDVKKSRREHIIDWWQQHLGRLTLKEITRALLSEVKDKLVHGEMDGKNRKPATVVKYLATLSHIFSKCVNEWQWLEENPVSKISKPALPKGRNRFLDDGERKGLLEECKKSENPYLYLITVIAISTGMRRSEILTLTWPDIDFERGRIVLRETKNGKVRVIPLVGFTYDLLKQHEQSRTRIDSILLFPGTLPNQPIDFRSAWRVAVRNAGLQDFKFHDLRHSFASYCVMNGLPLKTVGTLLGHSSTHTAITDRYCHLSDAYQKDGNNHEDRPTQQSLSSTHLTISFDNRSVDQADRPTLVIT